MSAWVFFENQSIQLAINIDKDSVSSLTPHVCKAESKLQNRHLMANLGKQRAQNASTYADTGTISPFSKAKQKPQINAHKKEQALLNLDFSFLQNIVAEKTSPFWFCLTERPSGWPYFFYSNYTHTSSAHYKGWLHII